MLKADSQGFLIADKPLAFDELSSGIDGVRNDTSAILRLLQGSAKANMLRRQRVQTPGAPGSPLPPPSAGMQRGGPLVAPALPARMSATPSLSAAASRRTRDELGRFVSSGVARNSASADLTPVAKAVDSMTRQQAAQKAREKLVQDAAHRRGDHMTDSVRDGRGRFVGKGRRGGSGGDEDSESRGLIERLKGMFSRVSAPNMGDFEKVDPTVEAAKEVRGMLGAPLAAVGNLGKAAVGRVGIGGKNPAIPWYRRIFGILKLSHDETSAFNLAQERTLKEIDRKSGGASGGAHGGGMLGAIGSGARSVGGMLGSLGKGAFSLGKLGLRRLPLLGALFAGGSTLASMFGPDDPTKRAAENRQDRFTGAGSGIGALVGGGIGTLLGGPVGAMIGGVIGDKVGELVGGWLSTLDWTEIGKEITGAWDTTVSFVKDTWKGVTDKLDGIAKTVGSAWNAIVDSAKAFLKDKFGIDVDALLAKGKDVVNAGVEKAKQVAAPVVDVAKKGADVAKDAGKAAVDYGKERVEKMAAPIKRVADSAVDFGKGLMGGGSKGNKAALMQGMVDGGISNPTEQAMFLAQMDHESGGFRSLEESSNYKPKQFLKLFGKRAGITTEQQAQAILDKGPSATFDAMYGGAWGAKNLGNTQTGDAELFKGRGFTQLTGRANYTAAARGTGLDLVNHPELAADPANAAKIAVWFHKSRKGLVEASREGDVATARRAVNGGLVGIDDVKQTFGKYLAQTTLPGFTVASAAGSKKAAPDAAPATAPTVTASTGPAAPTTPTATAAPVAPTATAVAPAVVMPTIATADAARSAATLAPPPAVTAAAPSFPRPSVARVSIPPLAAPTPAAQASIQVPINSAGPMSVRIANDEPVGQDVRDRRLAQIATGGIAA